MPAAKYLEKADELDALARAQSDPLAQAELQAIDKFYRRLAEQTPSPDPK